MGARIEASYPPEAFCRADAARYVGVSGTTFDVLVENGVMPRPRKMPEIRRVVWLKRELDRALEDLPVDGKPANDDDEGPDL